MSEQPGRDAPESDKNKALPALKSQRLPSQNEEMYAALHEDLNSLQRVTAGLRGFLKELKEQGVVGDVITQVERLLALSEQEAKIFQKSINISKPIWTSEDELISSDEAYVGPTMEPKPGHEDEQKSLDEEMVQVRDEFSDIVTPLLEGDNQALAAGLGKVFDEAHTPPDISAN